VRTLHRDASVRGGQGGARDMKEDRASPSLRPGGDVIVEHHDEVVEGIVPPEAFRARRVRQFDEAIVIAVAGRIAPPQVGPKRFGRKRRFRPPQSIGAIIDREAGPRARRGRSVTLLFQGSYAALPKSGGKM